MAYVKMDIIMLGIVIDIRYRSSACEIPNVWAIKASRLTPRSRLKMIIETKIKEVFLIKLSCTNYISKKR